MTTHIVGEFGQDGFQVSAFFQSPVLIRNGPSGDLTRIPPGAFGPVTPSASWALASPAFGVESESAALIFTRRLLDAVSDFSFD